MCNSMKIEHGLENKLTIYIYKFPSMIEFTLSKLKSVYGEHSFTPTGSNFNSI